MAATASGRHIDPWPEPLHDPTGRVAIRYTATRLTGCLYETMARFRPSPAAEVLLAAVGGVDADDVDWPQDDVPAVEAWLAVQRVGTVRVLDQGRFVDIEAPDVLVQLDKHPAVRDAIAGLDPSGRLDTGFMRLGGSQLGRPISQAVGLAVREWMPDANGIAYTSRLADEPCWAIWDTTHVEVTDVPLDPADGQHLAAVRRVAHDLEITLPDGW